MHPFYLLYRAWPSAWFSGSLAAAEMPIYEYEPSDGTRDQKPCCGSGFTLRRPVSAKPLEKCPCCKRPVRKIISSFNTPTHLKPLSISDAKNAGFTVLKKSSKGEYERQ